MWLRGGADCDAHPPGGACRGDAGSSGPPTCWGLKLCPRGSFCIAASRTDVGVGDEALTMTGSPSVLVWIGEEARGEAQGEVGEYGPLLAKSECCAASAICIVPSRDMSSLEMSSSDCEGQPTDACREASRLMLGTLLCLPDMTAECAGGGGGERAPRPRDCERHSRWDADVAHATEPAAGRPGAACVVGSCWSEAEPRSGRCGTAP
mmetsp:Transcript_20624/g.61480  ORF Transcript_20624/g.61480 Transcript_20624/m.61480 type:complete len:207 (+) Transcript_20624:405-1025(+)